MTYMFILKCALKLVLKNILYIEKFFYAKNVDNKWIYKKLRNHFSKSPAAFFPRIANNAIDMPCSLYLVILRIYVQAVLKVLPCLRQGNLKPDGTTSMHCDVRLVPLLFSDVLILVRYKAPKDKKR